MSDPPANGAAGRLTACRSCGNRVAGSARRCPACGERDPTGASPPDARQRPAPPRRRWGLPASLAGAALAGAAVSAAVFALRPAPPPPAIEHRPETPAAIPEAPAPAPAPPAVPALPRSRGRADWLFFFKAGDQLVRMDDGAPIGMVLRTVPEHSFPDGTTGPAYLVQVPAGAGQRFIDADELERGGRLQ
jgi:hypothetical protein